VEAADAEDVALTVRHARASGLGVTAQGNGHGATGRALHGTILIRTSQLQDLHVDGDRHVARVGAGVKWGALLEALEGTGLLGLCGSSPDVTVVGYLLGGGLSWFSRRFGMAASYVVAVEMVDPTGQQVRVTADSDPELFWALRGAGGDFGIVTAVEIRLHPNPGIVGGKLMFPVEQARDVLRAFRDTMQDAPEELTMWASIMHFPPLPMLPEPLRGNSFAVIDVTYLGPRLQLDPLLAPMRAAGTVLHDSVDEVAISQLGDVAAEPVDPMPAADHGNLLQRLDDETIDTLLEFAGNRDTTPLVALSIRRLGGALSTASADAGVAAKIDEPWLLFALGVLAVPELGPALEATFSGVDSVLGDAGTGRAPYNFLGRRGVDAAFDLEELTRLRALKLARDPLGVIRSARPL
jgi:FAD/FMN-containing dehydrogenase